MATYPWAAGYVDDGDRPKIVTARFEHEDSYTITRSTPPRATPG